MTSTDDSKLKVDGDLKGNVSFGNNSPIVGDNSPVVQIDKLIVEGRFDDALRVAEQCLRERKYAWAAEGYERYLKAQGTDPASRADAYLFAAIARLRYVRPDLHSATDVRTVAEYIEQARNHRYAPVLAALLLDDTTIGDVGSRQELHRIAAEFDANALGTDDLRFLLGHLPACDGPTWKALRARGAQVGVEAEPFVEPSMHVTVDPQRRELVPKYFIPDPIRPATPSNVPAIVFTVLAVGGFALCLLGSTASGNSGGNVGGSAGALACVGALLGIVSIPLSIAFWKKYGKGRRDLAAYNAAWYVANPKPSDDEMDAWLQEDIARFETLGITRHRLNRQDLVIPPKAIVGISSRVVKENRTQWVPDPYHPAGPLRPVLVETIRLVARLARGRDRSLRADNYHILVLYLTADRVCTYDVELELATRNIIQEKREAFKYSDIVQISVETRPATEESKNRLRDDLNRILGPGADIREVEATQDQRFAMALVNGREVAMSIGFGLSVRGNYDQTAIKWRNEDVIRTVESEVWSRRQSGH